MGKAEWGVDPEFFGPRHAHREWRITRRLQQLVPVAGFHLECAAGVGSLSIALARRGHTVVAADLSLQSMRILAARAKAAGDADRVLPIVADVTRLPFVDGAFPSASSAETLEHVSDHGAAIAELGRVLSSGGWLVGTVPAGRVQWSEWDDWAGHLRRYEKAELASIFEGAGLDTEVTVWGWPLLRLYDGLFLKRINRRRLRHEGTVDGDRTLSAVSALGRQSSLVTAVRWVFGFDCLFDGAPWGVGLLFSARKR